MKSTIFSIDSMMINQEKKFSRYFLLINIIYLVISALALIEEMKYQCIWANGILHNISTVSMA